MKADYFHNRNRAADQGEKKDCKLPFESFSNLFINREKN